MQMDIERLDKALEKQTKTIAQNIKHLRTSSCIKIKDFADMAGLTDSKISDIENCRATNMELRTMMRLALAFEVDLIDLLRDWQFKEK